MTKQQPVTLIGRRSEHLSFEDPHQRQRAATSLYRQLFELICNDKNIYQKQSDENL